MLRFICQLLHQFLLFIHELLQIRFFLQFSLNIFIFLLQFIFVLFINLLSHSSKFLSQSIYNLALHKLSRHFSIHQFILNQHFIKPLTVLINIQIRLKYQLLNLIVEIHQIFTINSLLLLIITIEKILQYLTKYHLSKFWFLLFLT